VQTSARIVVVLAIAIAGGAGCSREEPARQEAAAPVAKVRAKKAVTPMPTRVRGPVKTPVPAGPEFPEYVAEQLDKPAAAATEWPAEALDQATSIVQDDGFTCDRVTRMEADPAKNRGSDRVVKVMCENDAEPPGVFEVTTEPDDHYGVVKLPAW
jgi:hypothetical protein